MNPVDDLLAQLEMLNELSLAIADRIATGRAPRDETGRDRCRAVAERVVGTGRRVVALLATPPRAFADDAAFVAEVHRILGVAADREPGEEP